MCKGWEDYSKNWMHFMYKLDHLFQSTRVSHENSSVTKTFHFSKVISTQEFFLHPTCIIQSHILKFQPFLTSFAIFHAFNDFLHSICTIQSHRRYRKLVRLNGCWDWMAKLQLLVRDPGQNLSDMITTLKVDQMALSKSKHGWR